MKWNLNTREIYQTSLIQGGKCFRFYHECHENIDPIFVVRYYKFHWKENFAEIIVGFVQPNPAHAGFCRRRRHACGWPGGGEGDQIQGCASNTRAFTEATVHHSDLKPKGSSTVCSTRDVANGQLQPYQPFHPLLGQGCRPPRHPRRKPN